MERELPSESTAIFHPNLPENRGTELENPLKSDPSAKITDKQRAKTSLRLKYEAEARVIRKKLGSLEEIRQDLGLSRRKICQILMVDPSAWTRWTKDEGEAPPHIYRALQWYSALIDKHPEWHPQNSFFSGVAEHAETKRRLDAVQQELREKLSNISTPASTEHEGLQEELSHLKAEYLQVKQQLEKSERINAGWKFLLLMNSTLLLLALIEYLF